MEQQLSFAQEEYARKKKTTRRDKFLAEMNRVVPWTRLVELILPHYPKGKRGRPPIGTLERVMIFEVKKCCTPEQGTGISCGCPKSQPAHRAKEEPFIPAMSVMRNGPFAPPICA